MKRLTYFILALLVMVLPACAETIEAKARIQAQKDIEAGKPEYRIYGESTYREDILGNILKTKYGVILHQVAGCVVTESLRKETAAYNTTVAAHLKKVYQKDVFATAEAEFIEQRKREIETAAKAPTPEKP